MNLEVHSLEDNLINVSILSDPPSILVYVFDLLAFVLATKREFLA